MEQSHRSNTVVPTFLSCSIREADRPLVDALVDKVLTPMGFRCFTVGRNVSQPMPVDDAVKKLVKSCDCLIGVATVRLSARDHADPNKTLLLASPYVLQETSMAYQASLPFLIIQTPDVDLQGVTRRHLSLRVEPTLSSVGAVRFRHTRALVYTSLEELKRQAAEQAKRRTGDEWKARAGWLSTAVLAGAVVYKGVDLLLRPSCFGGYYYKDTQCGPCKHKTRCQAQKKLQGTK